MAERILEAMSHGRMEDPQRGSTTFDWTDVADWQISPELAGDCWIYMLKRKVYEAASKYIIIV